MEGIESGSKQGKRVVVIGGGIAGSLAAKLLQFDAEVTLIDP
jgi:NADH dehydrogenase FAD-containing subunit